MIEELKSLALKLDESDNSKDSELIYPQFFSDYIMYANLIFIMLFDMNIFEYMNLTQRDFRFDINLDSPNFAGINTYANHLRIMLQFLFDIQEILETEKVSKKEKKGSTNQKPGYK